MTHLIVVSHGALAAGLVDAATMIVGPQPDLVTLSLQPEDDPAGLEGRLRGILPEPDAGALVLVDLFGASPANAAAALLRDRADVEIVSGVSLPMLVEVLVARDSLTAFDLAQRAVSAGSEGIKDVGAIVRRALANKQEVPAH
jgi:mannose PTS system EIIA component